MISQEVTQIALLLTQAGAALYINSVNKWHISVTLEEMLYLLIPTVFLINSISTQVELIPREVLFQDAKYSSVSLSPDGQQVGFISPDNNKVKNVFVKCDTCTSPRQVTFESEPVLGKLHLEIQVS